MADHLRVPPHAGTAPHWHDVDNCGYVLEGRSYVLNEHGERVPLGPGDKLVVPAGAVHAEGEVSERIVYIVGIPEAANLFEELTLLDPKDSPLTATSMEQPPS